MHSSIFKDRLGMGLLGLVAISFFLFTGCATTAPDKTGAADELTTPTSAETAADANTEEEAEVSVESISIVGEGDTVLIETNGTVQYTAFVLTDPTRLIIDMPGVNISNVLDSIIVENQYIKEINAASYGGTDRISRIILELKEGVDHEVKAGENSILITLKQDPLSGEVTPVAEDSSYVVASAGDVTAPVDETESVVQTQTEPSNPASSIKDLEFSQNGATSVLQIVADGDIGNYNTFELDEPARIVIDVWGVTNSSGRDVLRVDGEDIKKVRIGSHPDKVRFVIDTVGEEMPSYVITKTSNYIVATFNPVAEAQLDVQDPVEAMPEAASVADVAVEAVAETPVETEEPVVEEESVVDVAAVAETPVEAEEPVAEEVVAEEVVAVMTEDDVAAEDPGVTVTDAAAVADSEYDTPAGDARVEENTVEEVAVPEETTVENEVAVPEEMAVESDIAAPEEMAIENDTAPQEEPEVIQAGTNITNIDYKKIGDRGYLTIEGDNKPVYKIKEAADGKNLVLDIKDAAIAKELVRTLDATRLNTPVAAISSYQSSVKPAEVRVLIELREKTDYDLRDMNNTISMMFSTPAAVEEETPQAQAPGAGAKKYTGKKINLDMMDAKVTDILRLLAEVSDLNIIASDDVTGTISLRLKDVPWDQAFDIILKSKSLGKVQEGNVIRVAPATKISQEKESFLAAKKASEKLEPLDIKFIAVNYANAASLETQIKSVLSDRGSVTSEERTNTLIIRDIKKGIASAVNLISKLDTAIPQVLIEARIVEASTSFARDLGIQWGVDYQTDGNVSTDTFGDSGTTPSTPPSSTVAPAFETRHGTSNYAVNLPASGTAGTLGALGFVLGKAGQNPLVLDLRISAGEQEGRLRTISRPRVVTMDNKEAKIEQGESIPFETTSASGTSTTFVDANLSLTVTPHITPDGSILMKIKMSRNSIGTFRTSSGEPSIDKKESSTEVLVKDGETTVIGGVVVNDKSETDSGIPYLRKIPVLGWLFKSKSITDTQTELLLFITPTIVKDKIVI